MCALHAVCQLPFLTTELWFLGTHSWLLQMPSNCKLQLNSYEITGLWLSSIAGNCFLPLRVIPFASFGGRRACGFSLRCLSVNRHGVSWHAIYQSDGEEVRLETRKLDSLRSEPRVLSVDAGPEIFQNSFEV